MSTSDLRALRARYRIALKSVAAMERQLARRRAELAEIEQAIVALTGAPPPVPMPRKPNPTFRPGDIPKLVLTALREAEKPLPVRDLVSYLLAAKGIPDAPQVMRDAVANRVRVYLWRAGQEGLIRVVGEGNDARRELILKRI